MSDQPQHIGEILGEMIASGSAAPACSLPPTTDRGVSLQSEEKGKEAKLSICIHWFAFTVPDGSAAAIKLLTEKLEDLGGWSGVPLPHGGYGYRSSMAGSFGIKLYFSDDRPEAYVVMAGATCDQLPTRVLVGLLFACANNKAKLRRIDIALDGLVDLDGRPISPRELFERVKADRSLLRTWANRDSIAYHEDLSPGGGETLDIGSRTSERFVRIYSRRGATRLELELKGDRAETFAPVFAAAPATFGEVAVGVVRDFLDFVESSNRPATAPLQPWWAAMVEAFQRVKLRIEPQVIGMDQKWDWLKRQVAASVVLMCKASGRDPDIIMAKLLAEGEQRFSGRHEALLKTVQAGWKPE